MQVNSIWMFLGAGTMGSDGTPRGLLIRREFAPIFWTQGLIAFGDHLLRNLTVFTIVYVFSAVEPMRASAQSSAVLAAYSAPYFLFSSIAGELIDRADKAALARKLAAADLGIMLLASVALLFESVAFVGFVLFLAGCRATVFSPLKFAILPEQLHRKTLLAATGYIEASSFVAVVGGQIIGGMLGAQAGAVLLLAVAASGFFTSLAILPTGQSTATHSFDLNLARGTWRIVHAAMGQKGVRHAILSLSWFYAVGAVVTGQFATFARNELDLPRDQAVGLLVIFSSGVLIGSLVAGWIGKGRIDARHSWLNATLLAAFLVDLGFSASSMVRVWIDVFGLGLAAAAYAVPFQTILQVAGPPERRGRDLAANNIVNAVFVVIALGVALLLVDAGASILTTFVMLGTIGLGVAFIEWHATRSGDARQVDVDWNGAARGELE